MDLWKKFRVVKAYKEVFETPAGKLVLEDLARECGLLRNTYHGKTDDLLFNEGKRNVGLYILANTNVDLKQLTELLRQSQEEKSDE